MKAYMMTLNAAHEKDGAKGTVTIASLASHFNTPAWKDLKNKQSEFVAFLRQTCEGDDESSFDYQKLVMLGLLYCVDGKKPTEKAIALFNLLQEGGAEKQEYIAAGDKDFPYVMHSILSLASTGALLGSGCMQNYSPEEQRDMGKGLFAVSGVELPSNLEEADQFVAPDPDDKFNFIDVVFGVQSKVTYALFLEQTITRGPWFFNAATLREKLWAHAEIPIRHLTTAS